MWVVEFTSNSDKGFIPAGKECRTPREAVESMIDRHRRHVLAEVSDLALAIIKGRADKEREGWTFEIDPPGRDKEIAAHYEFPKWRFRMRRLSRR